MLGRVEGHHESISLAKHEGERDSFKLGGREFKRRIVEGKKGFGKSSGGGSRGGVTCAAVEGVLRVVFEVKRSNGICWMRVEFENRKWKKEAVMRNKE